MRKRKIKSTDSPRIQWIDLAKCIAIILTIVGHTVGVGHFGNILRGMIFSFHMPLFFIVSGYTMNTSNDYSVFRARVKKSFKHLIVPALVTYIIAIIWQCINDVSLIRNIDIWKSRLYVLFYASGVPGDFNGRHIAALGAQWFFFALFFGKILFYFATIKTSSIWRLMIVSIVLGCAGVWLGTGCWLPFSLDVAMAVIPFLFLGHCLRNVSLENKWIRNLVICFLVWGITLYIEFPDYNNWTYLELAARRYFLFPLCYLTAAAGCMCAFIICVQFEKLGIGTINKPLMYFGRNSLYLFCVHIVDSIWEPVWHRAAYGDMTSLVRIATDLIVFLLVMQVRWGVKLILRSR